MMSANPLRRNIRRYVKVGVDGEKSSGTQAGRSISSTDRGTEHTVLYSQAARPYGQAGGRGLPATSPGTSNGAPGPGFPTRSETSGRAAAQMLIDRPGPQPKAELDSTPTVRLVNQLNFSWLTLL